MTTEEIRRQMEELASKKLKASDVRCLCRHEAPTDGGRRADEVGTDAVVLSPASGNRRDTPERRRT